MMENRSYVNPQELGTYLEGDILFQNKPSFTRSGIVGEQYRWPKGQIFVKFSARFGEKINKSKKSFLLNYFQILNYTILDKNDFNKIAQAMQIISSQTCIRFYYHSNQKDYVDITSNRAGCFAAVGRQGGRNQLNLQPNGCTHVVSQGLKYIYLNTSKNYKLKSKS